MIETLRFRKRGNSPCSHHAVSFRSACRPRTAAPPKRWLDPAGEQHNMLLRHSKRAPGLSDALVEPSRCSPRQCTLAALDEPGGLTKREVACNRGTLRPLLPGARKNDRRTNKLHREGFVDQRRLLLLVGHLVARGNGVGRFPADIPARKETPVKGQRQGQQTQARAL